MHEDVKKNEIKAVVNLFVNEIEESDLAQHLLTIYREMGIEP